MKNKMIVIIILIALILTACGTAANANQSATTSKTKSFAGQAELIVGIIKLEGTDQALTTKQASELLPLWEVMKVLANSDTSAQVEIDAAFREVNETLTPAQLQAIKTMKLTAQDVSAFEQGLTTAVQSSSKSSSSSNSGGGFGGPDGGGPGGDELGAIVAGVSQTSTSSTLTTQVSSGASSQVPTALINALIKVLQKRVSA
jgi:uncharacterized membrane protein